MDTETQRKPDALEGERVQPDGPLSGAVERGGIGPNGEEMVTFPRSMLRMPGETRKTKSRRFVYIVQAEGGGLVKIGVADTPLQRLVGLSCMSPVRLVLIGLLTCDRGGAMEKELHGKFAAHRHHGEWFNPHEDILDFADRFGVRLPQRILAIQHDMDRPTLPSGRRARTDAFQKMHHVTRRAAARKLAMDAEERCYQRDLVKPTPRPAMARAYKLEGDFLVPVGEGSEGFEPIYCPASKRRRKVSSDPPASDEGN